MASAVIYYHRMMCADAAAAGLLCSQVEAEKPWKPDTDTYYFNSYSYAGIHREMVADTVRGTLTATIAHSHCTITRSNYTITRSNYYNTL